MTIPLFVLLLLLLFLCKLYIFRVVEWIHESCRCYIILILIFSNCLKKKITTSYCPLLLPRNYSILSIEIVSGDLNNMVSVENENVDLIIMTFYTFFSENLISSWLKYTKNMASSEINKIIWWSHVFFPNMPRQNSQ